MKVSTSVTVEVDWPVVAWGVAGAAVIVLLLVIGLSTVDLDALACLTR